MSLWRGCQTPEENEMHTDDKDTAASTNPLDLLSDEEYEKHIAAEAQAQLEAQFDGRKSANSSKTKRPLLEKLHTARGYEQALMETKLALMDEYKAVQDHGMQEPVIMHDSGFSSVGGKINLYYNTHGEYIRIRSHERSKEETLHDADRNEESKGLDQPQNAPIFAATISNTTLLMYNKCSVKKTITNLLYHVLIFCLLRKMIWCVNTASMSYSIASARSN
ncbi:hypothetical protein OXX79_003620 [Metschnikowia pulcherrima]